MKKEKIILTEWEGTVGYDDKYWSSIDSLHEDLEDGTVETLPEFLDCFYTVDMKYSASRLLDRIPDYLCETYGLEEDFEGYLPEGSFSEAKHRIQDILDEMFAECSYKSYEPSPFQVNAKQFLGLL